jgi:hypothetical protein
MWTSLGRIECCLYIPATGLFNWFHIFISFSTFVWYSFDLIWCMLPVALVACTWEMPMGGIGVHGQLDMVHGRVRCMKCSGCATGVCVARFILCLFSWVYRCYFQDSTGVVVYVRSGSSPDECCPWNVHRRKWVTEDGVWVWFLRALQQWSASKNWLLVVFSTCCTSQDLLILTIVNSIEQRELYVRVMSKEHTLTCTGTWTWCVGVWVCFLCAL